MRYCLLAFMAVLLAACGMFEPEDPPENPTTCRTVQLEEGVEFTCVDRDGNETTGVVRHGLPGEAGATGPRGETGAPGEGLRLVKTKTCEGAIEGWLADSGYEVSFEVSYFETGDRFARSVVTLVRGTETLNNRTAAGFFLVNFPHTILSDGLLVMRLVDGELKVSSQGGINATIECEVE